MKKTLAATAALLAFCSFALAAPPPGTVSSQRIHVSPSQRMYTPIHNRVRMTPSHGQLGPVGGRMSSMPDGYHHDRPSSGHVYVRPSHARVYVRPSLPVHYYYRPLPSPPLPGLQTESSVTLSKPLLQISWISPPFPYLCLHDK